MFLNFNNNYNNLNNNNNNNNLNCNLLKFNMYYRFPMDLSSLF